MTNALMLMQSLILYYGKQAKAQYQRYYSSI